MPSAYNSELNLSNNQHVQQLNVLYIHVYSVGNLYILLWRVFKEL